MHHLLKRQLKKTGVTVDAKFLELVNQAYIDADEDRNLLEHSLDISSHEMKELYEELKEQSAKKLRLSETRYDNLVTALKGLYFFYAHDTQGIMIYASSSMTDILGYQEKEFLKNYAIYLTDDKINEKIDVFTQATISGEQQDAFVVSVKHKNGNIVYLEISEFPVFDTDGKVIEIEGIARDVTSQYVMHQKLNYISQHDTLTGVLNRHSIDKKLEYLLLNAKQQDESLALLFIDLDYFKEVNDSLGHDVGDILLKESVKRVQSLIRESDLFARIGGDEFIITLSNINHAHIKAVAQKIVSTLNNPFKIKDNIVNISASIGICIYPQDAKDKKTLLKCADKAMYQTKEHGKNGYSFYSHS